MTELAEGAHEHQPVGLDEMTGLPNEYAFINHVSAVTSFDDPNGLGVIYVDPDGFKKINELFGHEETGNPAIKAVTRDTDYVASRLHGDEFAVKVHVLDPSFRGKTLATEIRSNEDRFGDRLLSVINRLENRLPELFRRELGTVLLDQKLQDDGADQSEALKYAQTRVAEIFQRIPRFGFSVGGALWEPGDSAEALIK